jgi:Holliday junction resolvase RusA-like endonuclease
MAVHLEFVVAGPPVSNQQSTPAGRANLTTWRGTVAGAATLNWPNLPLTGDLKAILINFYAGNRPSVDVDNMSKPILDVMQNLVYGDDRQIVQAEITHLKIGAAFAIMGVRPIIVSSIQSGNEFVYVRIEDAVDPFPLPK